MLSRVKSVFKPRKKEISCKEPVQRPIHQESAQESSSTRFIKPEDRGLVMAMPSNASSSDHLITGGDDPQASEKGQVRKRKTDFGDSDRTEERYTTAVKQLESCLADSLILKKFDFLDVDELLVKDDIAWLGDKIDEMLQCRHSQAKNRNFIRKVFAAIAPLSKALLTVMTQSQPVLPSTSLY
jgi:hypothetical protein